LQKQNCPAARKRKWKWKPPSAAAHTQGPADEKNAILEIRAGTGGDEASLFAGDLLRMYLKYCERRGWKTSILSESEGTVGGYKEVQVEVVGDDVTAPSNFESGVHRVQRVPIPKAAAGCIPAQPPWP